MIRKVTILLAVMSAAAAAQSSNGYLFVAPGGVTSGGYTSMTIQAGAGADIHLVKGLGLNLELGAVGPRDDFSAVVGMFSPGATWYFRRGKELKLEPFVNGGYTLMFREGHANLFYFGGGATYWPVRHAGLRFEFRDQVYAVCCSTSHYWGFRLGLALR